MRSWTIARQMLTVSVVLPACGRSPTDVFTLASGSSGGDTGESTGEEEVCDPELENCTSVVTLQRAADILFVIDNSGSMGEEQAILANNFGSFIEVLEADGVEANYRVGVTT
ncbi:MAG: VWA domain-containing protein, partial [Nannocystaceae bacterium]|nr:VWA domain-containing protein [Nannocystaceae bacterium]